MASNQDGRRGDHGQGDVQHPETDRRLKQNRDQESGQQGGQSASGGQDEGHRGQVKDPEHDGRLKQNREAGVSKHTTEGKADTEAGGQGRVKDPEHDGRLKQNR